MFKPGVVLAVAEEGAAEDDTAPGVVWMVFRGGSPDGILSEIEVVPETEANLLELELATVTFVIFAGALVVMLEKGASVTAGLAERQSAFKSVWVFAISAAVQFD
jgi:hypothetical protein